MKPSFRSCSFTIFLAVVATVSLSISTETLARGNKGSSNHYYAYKGANAVDGDTFRYGGQRYRIQQYNAPELGQPGSRAATRSLQNKLDTGSHQWKPVARDVYGRTIVRERASD